MQQRDVQRVIGELFKLVLVSRQVEQLLVAEESPENVFDTTVCQRVPVVAFIVAGGMLHIQCLSPRAWIAGVVARGASGILQQAKQGFAVLWLEMPCRDQTCCTANINRSMENVAKLRDQASDDGAAWNGGHA